MHRREGVVSWDMRMVETFKICHTFWEHGVVTSLLSRLTFHSPFLVMYDAPQNALCAFSLPSPHEISSLAQTKELLTSPSFLSDSVRLYVTSVTQTTLCAFSLPSPHEISSLPRLKN